MKRKVSVKIPLIENRLKVKNCGVPIAGNEEFKQDNLDTGRSQEGVTNAVLFRVAVLVR